MSPTYKSRPVAWVVKPEGEPIFSEIATRVEIVDEAGGEFVQVTDGHCNKVSLNPEEWPQLRSVLEFAFKECKKPEVAK